MRRGNRILVIDIGGSYLKLLRVKAQGERILLEDVQRTRLTSQDSLSSILGEMLKPFLGSPQMVILALSPPEAKVGMVELPEMSEKEFMEAAKWELCARFHLEPEGVVFSFLPPWEGEGSKIKSVVGMVEREKLLREVKLIEDLGLRLSGVKLTNVSLVNHLTAAKGIKALVDLGDQSTRLILAKDSKVELVRDIGLGGRDISKAVQEAFDLDLPASESLKSKAKLPVNEKEEVSTLESAICKVIDELAAELRLSLQYYRSRTGEEVREVIIGGGGGCLVNLPSYLSQKMGLEVKLGAPWSGMEAVGVVPALDEPEECIPRFSEISEGPLVKELALESGEEAFTQGIVEAVTDGAHRGSDAGVGTPLPEGDRCVLATLIRVMDYVFWFPLFQGHAESVKNELRTKVGFDCPSDDTTTPDVDHHGEVEEPFPGRDVGDVGDPKLVRAVGRKVTIDEVGRGTSVSGPSGCEGFPAPGNALQTCVFHQTSDPLSTDMDAAMSEFRMNPRCAVRTVGSGMNLGDQLNQRRIRPGTFRRTAILPCVVPAAGDTQQTAHRTDGKTGLVLLHELEPFVGTTSVSRANQAAAFANISRSSLSCLFSRRKRLSSSRSAVVKPSFLRPSSRSACRTQFRIAWADGSNSRASSSAVRPARTSSTIWRRNSAGYGGRVLGIIVSFRLSRARPVELWKTGPLPRLPQHPQARRRRKHHSVHQNGVGP